MHIQTDGQTGHHRHTSDAVSTVIKHACKALGSASVANFHVTDFMLHPNFWRMSTSCLLCHRKMAQLSLRWALLHSFGLFTLLFGLYDDGISRQIADAYTKLCKVGIRTRADVLGKVSFVP